MSGISHQPFAPTVTELRAGGDRIRRHRHDEHQLVYVSTGVLAVSTAGGRWVASAERAVWLPAGTWHEHRFYGASAFHAVGFDVDSAPLADREPTVIAVSPLLRELLVACTDETLSAPEVRRIRAVLRDQLRRTRQEPIMLPAAEDPRLAEACAIVASDLATPHPLAALASRVGAGERTLSRLFRDEFGMTYPQWRTRLRVFEAMILLAGGTPVTETAHRCGWATTSSFIDTFQRTMGRTPGAYRA
ncbi:helix-turn-helix transcriptional regulator [Solirubrobacter ginsenosidimutans]|uniref:HTH-type transcriptional regulator RipA n=1 Tax=Solirubrobacter ginsenosidimutans TaxID=490573 RepID=A0A9X3N185_9ACTN|nr:helix-turn-helix transcriptional regulator [Solirubrobacter ginsenosidimutans]MDA0166362.1 helix-turn-helix transcriptional regulator [Solirubrobacter ginsenosidimutans]